MAENYSFFSNKKCEYFPCHKVSDKIAEEDFNCLFCYCPLYLKKGCPGNPVYLVTANGEKIKDPNAPTPGYRNLIIYTRTYFFIEMLSELLNAAQEDVAESIYYLESNRLIVDNVSLSKLQTNGHPIRTLEDKLTSKGKDLIAFIIR